MARLLQSPGHLVTVPGAGLLIECGGGGGVREGGRGRGGGDRPVRHVAVGHVGGVASRHVPGHMGVVLVTSPNHLELKRGAW